MSYVDSLMSYVTMGQFVHLEKRLGDLDRKILDLDEKIKKLARDRDIESEKRLNQKTICSIDTIRKHNVKQDTEISHLKREIQTIRKNTNRIPLINRSFLDFQ